MRTIWKVVATVVAVAAIVTGVGLGWRAHRARTKLAEAARLTLQRAEQDDAQAQVALAHMYHYGIGVPRSDAEAADWERRAADNGDATAQTRLGYLYLLGRGLPQNYALALLWIRKAADQGYAGAEDDAGYMYYHGLGVPQDYMEAMRWYRKAAEQGDGAAQFGLAIFYERGEGTPQDYTEAARWYRRAADEGYVPAQDRLGDLYFYGQGVPQNRAEAYRWFAKAAAQGDDYANRSLSISMSPLARFNIVAGLLGGSWLSLSFFRRQHSGPVNLLRDSGEATIALIGLLWIAVAGLSWYGYYHHKIRRLNLYPNAFTWVRFAVETIAIVLLIYAWSEIKKKRDRAAQQWLR
jgi:hypothetical protein